MHRLLHRWESAQKHIEDGAKRVLISAPAKGVDLTVVYGVNDESCGRHDDHLQCVVHDQLPGAGREGAQRCVGIERGLMTTVHAYTDDQKPSTDPLPT